MISQTEFEQALKAKESEKQGYVAPSDPYDFLKNVEKIAQILHDKKLKSLNNPLDLFALRTSQKENPHYEIDCGYERSPEELARLEKLDQKRVINACDHALRVLDAIERKEKGQPALMDLGGLRLLAEKEKEKEKTVNNIIDAQKINPLDKHKMRMARAKLLGL